MSPGRTLENAGRCERRGEQLGSPILTLPDSVPPVEEIKCFLDSGVSYKLPLYACPVRAGFPSPADDYIEMHLDLNSHLIKNPAATFFVTASGDSMIGSGDMLIVDRSLDAANGKIIIAALNGKLTVKRLSRTEKRVQLISEIDKYKPIEITDEEDLVIWGVVTHVIHTAS